MHCSCIGICQSGQIRPEIWPKPNVARNLAEAEFGKNGRISDFPKPKFGATLVITVLSSKMTINRLLRLHHFIHKVWENMPLCFQSVTACKEVVFSCNAFSFGALPNILHYITMPTTFIKISL